MKSKTCQKPHHFTNTILKIKEHKNIWLLLQYVFLFFFIFFLYAIFVHLPIANEQKTVSQLMRLYLLILSALAMVLLAQKKATMPRLIILLLAAGVIMRIGYTLYTPYYIRSHDLGLLSEETSKGHANYIMYIYQNHTLPDSNEIQYYQPPLFHILCAGVMQLYHFLFPSTPLNALMDVTKLVSCFASVCTLIAMKKITEELECSLKASLLSLAVVSFFPNYYLTAGRVNNDSLAFLFLVLSLLYTLRWGRRHQTKDLYLLAVFIGLGMMTKLSVSIVAFLAAPLMLYYLWKQAENKQAATTIRQYAIFLLICAPLGLWYSFRNLIRFGQPLGYVLDITETFGITTLYRGNLPLQERFFTLPLEDIRLRPFVDTNLDGNINTYLLRTSLFGEFTFSNLEKYAKCFITINGILILFSLIAAVYVLVRETKSNWLRFGPVSVWIISMISYYSFNIKYPECCTMDFRYILITAFCGSICLGQAYELLANHCSTLKAHKKGTFLTKLFQCLILTATISFVLMSVLFYTSIK